MPAWRPFAQFDPTGPDAEVSVTACPRHAFAPRTRPGVAAFDLGLDWGVWARAGMGPVSGLLISEALARAVEPDFVAPQGRAALVRALRCLETGRMEGEAIRAAREKDLS